MKSLYAVALLCLGFVLRLAAQEYAPDGYTTLLLHGNGVE